jgi:hypothetical protein
MKFFTSQPRKEFQCRLISAQVEIQNRVYTVIPYDFDKLGSGFQVVKSGLNDEVYNVIHTETGINTCDCMDYLRRHQGNGYGLCKHGRALVELGLMPAPRFLKNPGQGG